tara:strand:- start:230 stop:406 length:177 start_codon:yes stop_codon:yes gene_type:complete
MKDNWKDRRIDAMNKLIKAYPKASRAKTEHFLDEYNAVVGSEATCKRDYKLERKAKND